MSRVFRIILMAIATAFVGCASTDTAKEDQVSSIPWNRPATWEGQGPFGSMLQGAGR